MQQLLHEDDERRPNKVLTADNFRDLKQALSHRVKLRMKLNLLGRMTSVAEKSGAAAGGGLGLGAFGSGGGGGGAGGGGGSALSFKSAPSSRQLSRESLDNDSRPGENMQPSL